MTINVTQDDIDNGVRGNSFKCPVALALIKAVGIDMVQASLRGLYGKYAAEVSLFIKNYDSFLPVVPFSFEIIT